MTRSYDSLRGKEIWILLSRLAPRLLHTQLISSRSASKDLNRLYEAFLILSSEVKGCTAAVPVSTPPGPGYKSESAIPIPTLVTSSSCSSSDNFGPCNTNMELAVSLLTFVLFSSCPTMLPASSNFGFIQTFVSVFEDLGSSSVSRNSSSGCLMIRLL